MSESHAKRQLVILEAFTREVQAAKTADEVAEILLKSLYEAFPGFDDAYVFLPDGQGRLRPVVMRSMGGEVSYPTKRVECLAESVTEAEKTAEVERLEGGSILAIEKPQRDEGVGIIGFNEVSSDLSPARSRLCIPISRDGEPLGFLQLNSVERNSLLFMARDEELLSQMHEFLGLAANALASVD